MGLGLTTRPRGFNEKEEKCILRDTYIPVLSIIELGKLRIVLFRAGLPILCCEAYAISLDVKDRSVGALAMESWPRDTAPRQGET